MFLIRRTQGACLVPQDGDAASLGAPASFTFQVKSLGASLSIWSVEILFFKSFQGPAEAFKSNAAASLLIQRY